MSEVKNHAIEETKKASPLAKAPLLYGDGAWNTHPIEGTDVKGIEMHDGPTGVRKPTDDKPKKGEMVGSSLPATCFPSPCLTACSWNPDALHKIGHYLGKEALEQKTDMILAPGVNIKRNPLCGRNFEYLSEDPYLAGTLAAGYINGVQENGVGTSLKHFAVNNQEYRRLTYSAEVDMRALRELYLRPFEIAIKEADPWSVMCSYNRINGVYSSDNDWLLKNVLRKEWGYTGVVVSDWGATFDPIDSHNHGLDLEMPCVTDRKKELVKALKNGSLDKDAFETSCERVAQLYDKVLAREPSKEAWNYGMSHEAAIEVAEESIVLAKNDGDILPLKDYKDVCIIGALAKHPRYQGAGSSQVIPQHLVSYLEAADIGKDAKGIPFSEGYSLTDGAADSTLAIDAVDLAATHKKVVLVLGLPESVETEGWDRKNMRLPDNQYSLFDAIYAVNKNIIVVLLLGAPVELPFADKAKAILVAYLPGEGGGIAINNLLTGKVNPSGKFAETWPYYYTDVPSHDFYPGQGDISLYKDSIFVGYRYYLSAEKEVLFPFGFGLSYTKFAFSNLSVSKNKISNGNLSVSLTIKNSGKVKGSEVVQLYVSEPASKTLKPLRELRAFKKVSLLPGKEKKVSFTIPFSAFSHYDVTSERYEVEGGKYNIEVGNSSSNILLNKEIEVVSSYKPIDMKSQLPTYFNLQSGSFHVTDNEYIVLLGHQIPNENAKRHHHYTLNSTFGEIRETLAGKIVGKQLNKMVAHPDGSIDEKGQNFIDMVMESPIRMLSMIGISEKLELALVDIANKRYLKALFDAQFGHRK